MTHIRIGLIDVDSHNFPNLCLMKLSAYHKAQGHQVCFWNPLFYFDTLIPDLDTQLEAMDIGPLLGLWFQTLVVGLTMNILSICIFLVTYGRMIEIYTVTALGPIPLATLGNAEWRGDRKSVV